MACVAMLAHLNFDDVSDASKELWGEDCWDDVHRTTISELQELLSALGWKMGRKTTSKDWKKVPAHSLVAVQFKENKGTWHWVVTDEDEEGPFVLDPRPSVKRDQRRDFKKLSLAWYHRVTIDQPKRPQWEIDLDREYAKKHAGHFKLNN
jgi:hypothetical protein